jgi:hypothetical protein
MEVASSHDKSSYRRAKNALQFSPNRNAKLREKCLSPFVVTYYGECAAYER